MTPASLDRVARALLGAVLDDSVRAIALAVAAGLLLAVLALPRGMRTVLRLRVWTAVLAGALLMPALGRVVPEWRIPLPVAVSRLLDPPPAEPAPAPAGIAAPAATAGVATGTATSPTPGGVAGREAIALDAVASSTANGAPRWPGASAASPSNPRGPISWIAVAALIYLAGAAWLLLRLVVGWCASVRLERRAAEIADAALQARVARLAAAAGLRGPVRCAESATLRVPMTSGVRRPVVLLPADWRGWTDDRLEAVLVHELAHVARRDALAQRLSLLYRALTWIGPLGWWLHRRLVDLGERASDEAALDTGIDRTEYAELLVGFFSAISRTPGRADWHVAMANGASVERRVERVLSWSGRVAHRPAAGAALALATALSSLTVAIAAARAVAPPLSAPAPAAPVVTASLPAVPRSPLPAPAGPERLTGATTAEATTAASSPAEAPQSVDAAPITMDEAQIVMLLFDLRTDDAQSRSRAIESAQHDIALSETKFDAGIGPPQLWGVATVSSDGPRSVGIVQEFTRDSNTLRRALATVAALPAPTFADNVSTEAIAALCGTLAGMPPSPSLFAGSPEIAAKRRIGTTAPIPLDRDAKGLIYYVVGGALTADEGATLGSACRRPNLVYRSGVFPVTASHAPSDGYYYLQRYVPPQPDEHLVAMVFDLPMLMGDARDRALRIARQFITDTMAETDEVSIAAFGDTLTTVEAATNNKPSLLAAIDNVLAMPMPATSPQARSAGISQICQSLSITRSRTNTLADRALVNHHIDPADVFYFGDARSAVEVGTLAPADVRDAEEELTKLGCVVAGVRFLSPVAMTDLQLLAGPGTSARQGDGNPSKYLGALGPVRAPEPFAGIALSVVAHQAGSPVTLSSTKTTLSDGYVTASVRNDTAKPIRSFSFGALLHPKDTTLHDPEIVIAHGPTADLAPGATIDVSTWVLDGTQVGRFGRAGADAEIGLVEVVFADGTTWTYDLKSRGRFER